MMPATRNILRGSSNTACSHHCRHRIHPQHTSHTPSHQHQRSDLQCSFHTLSQGLRQDRPNHPRMSCTVSVQVLSIGQAHKQHRTSTDHRHRRFRPRHNPCIQTSHLASSGPRRIHHTLTDQSQLRTSRADSQNSCSRLPHLLLGLGHSWCT